MPDDLLRHVFGPQPYSSSWLWWAALLILLVIGWYAGVFVWTLAVAPAAAHPRRAASARPADPQPVHPPVQRIADEHDAGRLSAPAACAAISRTVRSFFIKRPARGRSTCMSARSLTGTWRAAAPLLIQLGDAQFNAEARVRGWSPTWAPRRRS